MTWAGPADWWLSEIEDDPAYEDVVTPLALRILEPASGNLYLDLGSGDGRVMRAIAASGASVHGLDLNPGLAGRASAWGPTVVVELPDLGAIRPGSYDGACCVLVLEHIADHSKFFEEVAGVVREGGCLAIVMNHPFWTAPGSTPISDTDGEALWRPGEYFSDGSSDQPVGGTTVTFHHRSLGALMTAAAAAGWHLVRMEELPHHDLPGQEGIPRLLGARWRLG